MDKSVGICHVSPDRVVPQGEGLPFWLGVGSLVGKLYGSIGFCERLHFERDIFSAVAPPHPSSVCIRRKNADFVIEEFEVEVTE
jgi:hypothetical protein